MFVEPLTNVLGPPSKPSSEEAPKLELMALHSHFRCTLFGANESLHLIRSSDLFKLHVKASLKILRKR